MNLKDKIIIVMIGRTKMFNDIKKWFVGDASKKRYITALYVAVRAFLIYLGVPIPPLADQLAVAFGIWAAADAVKKLEPK